MLGVTCYVISSLLLTPEDKVSEGCNVSFELIVFNIYCFRLRAPDQEDVGSRSSQAFVPESDQRTSLDGAGGPVPAACAVQTGFALREQIRLG